MELEGIALGIDSSTQGTTALALDLGGMTIAAEVRIGYRDDPRFSLFGLGEGAPILPPRESGEADQPAALYLAGLDAVLSELPRHILRRVRAIDLSAQQHGQVWLGPWALDSFAALRREGAGGAGSPGLVERIAPSLASERAPIWLSSNAAREAAALREAAGGAEAMTALSGSDSPPRFSGALLRHKALREPRCYAASARIHLISSFLASALAGAIEAPIDWGNGSGTSLMNWSGRRWSELLLAAAAEGLPGGIEGLQARLPALAHPLQPVGTVARYFTERYGIPGSALVIAGSGDNPQTKVLAPGSLLSLGTSFVIMAEGDAPRLGANAMYDGLGGPFLFGCRTNGALAWESLRRRHGVEGRDFSASEGALAEIEPGSVLRIHQPEPESFPSSPPLELGARADFAGDYAGAVDAALGLLWMAAESLGGGPGGGGELAVTGGASASEGVLRRVAAIWKRPATRLLRTGAAAGAAIAAAAALLPEEEREDFAGRASASVAGRGRRVEPEPADLVAYHGQGGYLQRLRRAFDSSLA